MAFFLLGVNHKTAPVSVREKVAFAPELMHEALAAASARAGLAEVAILSTCNRCELYCVPESSATGVDELQKQLISWLAEYHTLEPAELDSCIYSYSEEDAIRHVMRVASGLDSMVLGEPQILGQIKSAYAVAVEAGTVGSVLHRVFGETFTVAKQVRTETAIGENPVSVAFAAVTLAQHIFSDLSQSRALLIGAGRTIELVVQHLKEAGIASLVVANRTLENAQELKRKYGVREVLLSDIPEELIDADIVVSSTASQLPILGKGAVERALKARKHKPIFMVDLAVPRDIEEEVGELDDAYLYCVDDLKQVIDSNVKSRQDAAQEAEAIIAKGLESFAQKQKSLGIVGTLRNYREKAELIRDAELEKALKALEKGGEPEAVLSSLARLLTNKLIHTPSVQLKKASMDGHNELIVLAEQLFELEASNEAVGSPEQKNNGPEPVQKPASAESPESIEPEKSPEPINKS